MIRHFISILLILAVLFAPCASQAQEQRLSQVGFFFDTVVTISAYVDSMTVLDEALEKCAGYEALLSKTVEGSDVWRINHAEGLPVEVSDETIYVLNTALNVSEISSGAFDITIAPAVSLWDFTGANNVLPNADELAQAASIVDYTKIEIDGNYVTLPAGMSIDLGGVAKGYIADQIAQFLRDSGVTSGILNFGGNVVVIGDKLGEVWRVGLQNPQQQTGQYLVVASVTDTAIVTSGIYERGFDLDGVRYHHLLDPSTGWPVQNELASVTIITHESAYADALSTAVFVMGIEKGGELINSLSGVEAVFIDRDNNIYASEGAQEIISG
ncbi:MAG: FAD:protein FMN transferase [Clostridia bacterium]|nr:FAD:protein FMN transferase [Clostridia bacterium]